MVYCATDEIVAKLRDADAMLNAGKDPATVSQALEARESKVNRWRAQYGGMKCEEAKRLTHSEDENRQLKQLVADQVLDIQMIKHFSWGTWQALPGSVWRSSSFAPSSVSPSEGHTQWSISRVAVLDRADRGCFAAYPLQG